MTDNGKLKKRDLILAVLSWIEEALAGPCVVPTYKITKAHVESALGEFLAKPERLLEVESRAATSDCTNAARDTVNRVFPEIKNLDDDAVVIRYGLVDFESVVINTMLAAEIGVEHDAQPPPLVIDQELLDAAAQADETRADDIAKLRESLCDAFVRVYQAADPKLTEDDLASIIDRLILNPENVYLPRAIVTGYFGDDSIGEHIATATEAIGVKKGDPVEFIIRKLRS